MIVKVKKLNSNAILPKQQNVGDVGLDLHTIDEGVLQPNERKLFKTGLAMQPPKGYELQIRPRSGLAFKHGITVLNSPATIEPTYRGDVGIILYNSGNEPFTVNKGDRIAQAVFKKYEEHVILEEVNELDESERGSNGFGSTGV
ncbi:dUTP diphosphatase [Terrihalobacillus insolitus]|uniref:dUTP diphosphatase n=1 Tax=Terrihalobacillus insolitus TaxID=2950438 RepID=UPI00234060B5|nr:dUTP diphosphatase [Terrihalobacillus insolitus]MDC3413928.1 dUTP diphosphatase [Terrihalobacillus insolitus]